MGSLALLRGISDAVACLAVRPGSGSDPTARLSAQFGLAAEYAAMVARGAAVPQNDGADSGRASAPSANGGQPWNTLPDSTLRWKRLRFA
jgi:hypothetical protein